MYRNLSRLRCFGKRRIENPAQSRQVALLSALIFKLSGRRSRSEGLLRSIGLPLLSVNILGANVTQHHRGIVPRQSHPIRHDSWRHANSLYANHLFELLISNPHTKQPWVVSTRALKVNVLPFA